MPAGGTTLGIIYFASVKLAGYTAAAVYLRRRLPENRPVLLAGATRTLIGLAAGFSAVFLADHVGQKNGSGCPFPTNISDRSGGTVNP